MKKTIVMACVALATSFLSCGSTQKTSSVDYQKERYQQQEQQYAQQTPAKVKRERTDSERLVMEDSDHWRALGIGQSYSDEEAYDAAQSNGRAQLAQALDIAVEGAIQNYQKTLNENLKSSSSTLRESVMTQFVAQEVKNSVAICFDTFDFADGQVQVYTCMEIKGTKQDFEKRLDNTLERDKLIENQYDRTRFIESVSKGLEEHKKKLQQND